MKEAMKPLADVFEEMQAAMFAPSKQALLLYA